MRLEELPTVEWCIHHLTCVKWESLSMERDLWMPPAWEKTLSMVSIGPMPQVGRDIVKRLDERFSTEKIGPILNGRESLSFVFAWMYERDLDFLYVAGRWPYAHNYNMFSPFEILAVRGYATEAALEVRREQNEG